MILYGIGGSLLHDLENVHRASLGADAAGDALGSVALRGIQHDQAERADGNALTAAVAELFVDAVNAGLLILGDSAFGAGTSAFSALNAGLRSGSAFLIDDLDVGFVGMELLIVSFGTGTHARQASHALHGFLRGKLLHNYCPPSI